PHRAVAQAAATACPSAPSATAFCRRCPGLAGRARAAGSFPHRGRDGADQPARVCPPARALEDRGAQADRRARRADSHPRPAQQIDEDEADALYEATMAPNGFATSRFRAPAAGGPTKDPASGDRRASTIGESAATLSRARAALLVTQ